MVNWAGAGQGALSGAATGSLFGAPGAVIGGLGGGLLGAFDKSQKKDKFKQLPVLNEAQNTGLNRIFDTLNGNVGQNFNASQNYLQSLLSGDPGVYDRFKAPFIQNFEQQILPRLSERFAGLGGGLGGGVGGSSGFGQAIGGAGAQLEGQLASLFANLQQQAASQSMNQYNSLLNQGLGTRAFENLYIPGNIGSFGNLLSGLGGGLGQGLGQRIGNNMFSNNSPGTSQWGDYVPGSFF